MDVYDALRKQIRLGREVGRGGEATVYEAMGRPDLLAKIYAGNCPGQDQKLAWMVAHPPDDPTRAQSHASIAWPLDLLYDDRGRFVGYLMPRIQNAVPLLEVFNPRLRARTLPGFDRRYLHRAARNLAAALGALHDCDYVVGDLNESNVLVAPSALVTLIDADSFQVQEQSGARLVIYPCPVGKPEYTPPELQGRSLRGTQRHPENDCFSLGVLVFQLLLGGGHPFRAQWKGRGDPPPVEEKIRRGWFPHAKSPLGPVAPPPNAPALDTLHPGVADLVRRCFVEGHQTPRRRPTPQEWENAIAAAEKALAQCRNGHFYSDHLGCCPQCGAIRRGPQRNLRAAPARPKLTPPAPPPKSAAVVCPACGHANQSGEIYCQRCARQLLGDRTCSHCRRSVPVNARYCPACKSRLP